MTFKECTSLEPKLLELEKYIKKHPFVTGESIDYCVNELWYGHIKPQLINLVGWWCGNPALRSESAYDACYTHLYDLFPDCDRFENCENHRGQMRGNDE